MISAYSQNGDPKVALKLFASMRRSGFSANQFTYGATLGACTRMDAIRVEKQVQGCIEESLFTGDLSVQSALVDLHMNCGLVENA
nr:pentatricopeptide repeat protein AaPPR942 [Agave angustifolia]UPT49607.1 pentatricopeptide repeat protein AaPPR943 [Agave angustifolia]